MMEHGPSSYERHSTTVKLVVILLIGAAFALAVETCSATAHAGISHCESIQNSDKRAYCKAVVSGNPSHCASINDSDLRNMCYAVTKP